MAVPVLSDDAGYAEGKPAVGTTVKVDLNKIVAELDGNIDLTNMAASSVGNTELVAGSVNNSKMAANAIYEANVYFGSASNGLLVPRAGPSYVGGGVPRLVRCTISFLSTVTGGAAWETETDGIGPHDIPTICIDGDPGFSTTAPTMLGAPVVTANDGVDGDLPDMIHVNAISTTSITLAIHFPASATVQNFTIEWGMLGQISA